MKTIIVWCQNKIYCWRWLNCLYCFDPHRILHHISSPELRTITDHLSIITNKTTLDQVTHWLKCMDQFNLYNLLSPGNESFVIDASSCLDMLDKSFLSKVDQILFLKDSVSKWMRLSCDTLLDEHFLCLPFRFMTFFQVISLTNKVNLINLCKV